ncbi:S8 family peptidase [Streptomyces zagrosensis]|uniref:Subtilisin family serine protease n=1 Tax=Streptomyces zagrosensis TaxID=1042984 RepID=A0A7W9UYZ2_9ACTN|nr:S8 family peptidase [Streptomyces zagrosensis]MBB5935866.1 subtilisin family serine protease [Streptomyces zagrosensis]
MTKNALFRSVVTAAAASALVLPLVGSAHAVSDTNRAETAVYVVQLNDVEATKDAVTQMAKGLVAEDGGTLRRVYYSVMQGFSVTLTQDQVGKYLKDTRVGSVTQDRKYRTAGKLGTRSHRGPAPARQDTLAANAVTQWGAPWGLDRMNQRNLPLDGKYTAPNTASNVRVYVVDTGVRASHQDLRGRVSAAYDAIKDQAGGTATDCNGHGTANASLAAGVYAGTAKQARIESVRALGCDGTGTLEHIASAVDWINVNAKKPAVVSLGFTGDPASVLDFQLYMMTDAGITYTAPAGNGNGSGEAVDACEATPGRQTTGITVSATDRTDRRVASANTGSCVHLFAPGARIPVASLAGDRYYTELTGTSASAAQVAGLAAMYVSDHPGATAREIDQALIDAATKDHVQDPGVDSENRLAYTGREGASGAGAGERR